MADDYLYVVHQCDVEDKKSLEHFRKKRRIWLTWLETDQHHAIWSVLSSMVWNDVSFRTMAQIAKEPDSAMQNSLLTEMIVQGHFARQVLAIRRLVDATKGTISLVRLLRDIRNNLQFFTRENYVSFDGLPYDYEVVAQKMMSLYFSQKDRPTAQWVDNKGPNAHSPARRAHEQFDKLAKIAPSNRRRTDTLPITGVAMPLILVRRKARSIFLNVYYCMKKILKKPSLRKNTGSKAFMEKFNLLHEGEESVRAHSVKTIQASSDLALHTELCEKGADLLHHFIHRDKHKDEDDLTIRLLGIRVFNSLNATLNLLLSGYYQAATLQMRDMIETAFLLDHLQTNRNLISRWRTATPKILRDEFAPVKVRAALDARDEYTGEKRGESYKSFCVLAGHPHPQGFAMIRLPDGTHHCGPFFDPNALQAVLSELGKSALQAVNILSLFFQHQSKLDQQIKLDFLTVQQKWMKRFYDTQPISDDILNGMQVQINNMVEFSIPM